eukprot:173063-Pelagomonas_calceolata.AAC.3
MRAVTRPGQSMKLQSKLGGSISWRLSPLKGSRIREIKRGNHGGDSREFPSPEGKWEAGVGLIPTACLVVDDIRRVEDGAYGLGAGQGVHFMCRHQCSKGCPTGFCVVSSC